MVLKEFILSHRKVHG